MTEKHKKASADAIRRKTYKTKQTVEIEIDLLRRIAEYYEFPLAVFFSDKSIFKHKTRSETLRKKAEAFDKIAEIVEDYKHENK